MIAPRFSRSDCSRLGSANPNRERPLVLEPVRLDQVHQPGGERHAGADRPGQQEDAVHRPPERRRAPPARPSRRRGGANQPAATTRPSTSGSTNTPTATGLGERTIRYRPISARIHDSTSSDSNDRRHRQTSVARPGQVRQVGRLDQPSPGPSGRRSGTSGPRCGPRTGPARSASARPYVPAKQRTLKRSMAPTLPAPRLPLPRLRGDAPSGP